MNIGRYHSWKKVIAQLSLLALPAVALAMYVLWSANAQYEILENRWLEQGLFFAAGITGSIILYSYRFRFITTALFLALIFYFAYKSPSYLASGEFDLLNYSVRIITFIILFSLGWLAGYGFSRSRYFTILWSVLLLAAQVTTVAATKEITSQSIIIAFAPILVFAFYLVYTAELIRNMNEDEKGFGWFIAKRLAGFIVLAAIILSGLLIAFQKEFKAIEKEWAGAKGGKEQSGKESMTKENKDGTLSNKDQTQLTGSLSKDKRLVFVARVDNFFPETNTPNPLYFTSRYYAKFDTLTQAFEVDDKAPYNDLFSPDPSKIPLYFTKTDSSVIKNSKATLSRQVVNADVYKVILSPDEFVAPSTAFYCQPVAVEHAYKDQFKSAYKAKMWVSDLNSAYFIYNPAGNPFLENFQEQRFAQLRNANNYSGIEKDFMDYYTFMPPNEDYKRIKNLALEITKDAPTPVDKMIAIRNYYTVKDEFGQPLFKYSDNPGVPGLPSASKLNYFLFENRKGYCAYFAGSTLFMLRSLGIPSRIAAGFLTVDRSSKNPGWYWFYADQAHAWVQVFFPGYGWLDFDTTIPDQNTQESQQPDGTPPLNIQEPVFVGNGTAVSVDTIARRMILRVKKILMFNKDYTDSKGKDLLLDVSIAAITKDTGVGKLSEIKPGTPIVAVSYAEALKEINVRNSDSLGSILAKLPKPTPIDEIKIMELESKETPAKRKEKEATTPTDWVNALWWFIGIVAAFLLVLFSLPWLIWQYLKMKAKQENPVAKKSFYIHRAATYYLNQLGYTRKQESPQQFAQKIDAQFTTGLLNFTNVYQKVKYSNLKYSENDKQVIATFFEPFIKNIRKGIPFKKRFSNFLNIYHTLHYFTTPKI